jgi:transcriptional regulator with XRE-family HTH domain
MVTMGQWTGRETRLLRQALRLTVRHFAEDLGVSPRTISKWETAGAARTPRPELQAALDTLLARATDQERERFRQAAGLVDETGPLPAPSAGLPPESPAVERIIDLEVVALSESAVIDHDPMKRRSLLMASGVAALGPTWSPVSARPTSPVHQALQVVAAGAADTLDTTLECLDELVEHYVHELAVTRPAELLPSLLGIRAYAGDLLNQSEVPRHRRPDILTAAGWFSNLLAIASSYLGDHASALVWCIDAERRSQEAAHPEIGGWAMLTRAMIAHYQRSRPALKRLGESGAADGPAGDCGARETRRSRDARPGNAGRQGGCG